MSSRVSVLLVFALVCLSGFVRAGAETSATLVQRLTSLQPGDLFGQTAQVEYHSSYDRTGGNADGFDSTYSTLYTLDNGQHVFLDIPGPGCLYTLWFTGPDSGLRLPFETLYFYLDNDTEPRLALEAQTLFAGDDPRFPRPLALNHRYATGGYVSQVPLGFQQRLIVAADASPSFFNAHVVRFPADTSVPAWDGRQDLTPAQHAWATAGSFLADDPAWIWQRAATDLPAGGGVQVWSATGPARIRAIRLNPARPLTTAELHALRIRLWWDDAATPAVDAPVGLFFGGGVGETTSRGLVMGMTPSGRYYCNFSMPFATRARLQLYNGNDVELSSVYWEVASEPLDQGAVTEHFYAVAHGLHAATEGMDFPLLELPRGHGRYLGQTLAVTPRTRTEKRWWEGDMRLWLDGRRHPVVQGTGHEDEYLGGWSSRWMQGPYSFPLFGVPGVELFDGWVGSQKNGAVCMYRLFAGGIPFRAGLRVSTEHGTENNVVTRYDSVCYFYYNENSAMTLTDALKLGDAADLAAHGYSAGGHSRLVSHRATFEGAGGTVDAATLAHHGRVGQATERFVVRLAADNNGVLLRRLFHKHYGRSRARVAVDGHPAGILRLDEDFGVDRWGEEDLILPASLTAGKQEIRLDINVLTGRWNAFAYTVYSLGAVAPGPRQRAD